MSKITSNEIALTFEKYSDYLIYKNRLIIFTYWISVGESLSEEDYYEKRKESTKKNNLL